MKGLIAVLILLLVVLQIRLWFGEGSIQEVARLKAEVEASREEIASLTQRNRAMAAEIVDLKSGLEAIEERARSELGMIGEGEMFIQFIRETSASVEANSRTGLPELLSPDTDDTVNQE